MGKKHDWRHQQERARWKPKVNTGTVPCARCHRLIPPGTPWDLGHNDNGPGWWGPEHRHCNRSAGAKTSPGSFKHRARRAVTVTSRRW